MKHSLFVALAATLLLLAVGSTQVLARTAAEWRTRAIYQLLTDRFANPNNPTSSCSNLSAYCGGTFKGIVNKLDYIQSLGFNAIWISPIVSNTDNGYHGYWAMNWNEINSNFGSEQDLKDLVAACHARDIWVMVDVVGNHCGNQVGGSYDFSSFVPFNSASHFHSLCQIVDWSNSTQVEYCRLANLPDLDQDNAFVRSFLKSWIANLTATYGIDGYRIDTVPEVKPAFWAEFADAAGVFTIGEVDNGDVSYNAQFQGPLNATLNYPMFYALRQGYAQKQSLKQISSMWQSEAQHFSDPTVLGNFVDNHDNTRFLNVNPDWEPLENALATVMFGTGIPIVYYGTEQGFKGGNDPNDRESLWPSYDQTNYLYQFIANLTRIRAKVLNTDLLYANLTATPLIESTVDDQFYSFYRGRLFVATTNIGSGQALTRTVTKHPYSDGTVLTDLLNSGTKVTVSGGSFNVNLVNGWPRVFYG